MYDRLIDIFPADQQQQIRVQLSSTLMAVCAQRLVPATGGGLVCATEVMITTHGIRNMIREGKSHQMDSVIQSSAEHGMHSMDQSLAQLVQQGKVSYDQARSHASDIKELDRLVGH